MAQQVMVKMELKGKSSYSLDHCTVFNNTNLEAPQEIAKYIYYMAQ